MGDFSTQPAKPWEFFYAARQSVGMSALQRIFGNRSKEQIYRWSRNPDVSADTQKGPLESMRQLVVLMDEQGDRDAALAGVSYLAQPLGVQLVFMPDDDTGGSVPSEMADALRGFVQLQELVRTGAAANVVQLQGAEVCKHIRRCVQAHGAEPVRFAVCGGSEDLPVPDKLLEPYAASVLKKAYRNVKKWLP
ncbi:MAG: hypothetical protein ACNI27_07305 [Desulfovibrio sp.]